ncbi:MAG TPA: hypothetical protein V6D20_19695, partial [Candidatus Obscuribacterales bacterium]
EIDAIALQEVGKNWKAAGKFHDWKAMIQDQLDFENTHASFAHNKHDRKNTVLQWGGTGLMTFQDVAHRAFKSGQDPTGLGRWVWTQYRGINGITTRVISAY